MADPVYAKMKSKLPGLQRDELLAPYTSFKIGGPAKYFFVARDVLAVAKAVKSAREMSVPFFILGSGSNILVADKGFDGLVIKMENRTITFQDTVVTAESGASLQKAIRESISKHLTGLEFLIGIPGTIGGGVAGNVGTPVRWIGEKISEVEVLNARNEVEIVPRTQCDFSYRSSRFKYSDTEIILAATFHLERSSQAVIQANIEEGLQKRAHQPSNKPSAGSVFKNPGEKKAWQLIEQVGCRGKQMGGAKVSDEHANFIINTGSATAEDIVILISYIKQQVRDELGIQLQEEIKYVGF